MVLYTKCIIIVFLFYVWCGSSICRSTDIRCGLYCYAKLARVDGMTRIGINQEVFLTVFNRIFVILRVDEGDFPVRGDVNAVDRGVCRIANFDPYGIFIILREGAESLPYGVSGFLAFRDVAECAVVGNAFQHA